MASKTTFHSLVCIRYELDGRNRIPFRFGFLNLYFVNALKPQSKEITKCEREIAQMDFGKYSARPNVHQTSNDANTH